MSFTFENKKENRMFFLDVQIKTFATSVYRKPTFSRLYAHFEAFHHIPLSLVLFTHSLIYASEYTQVRLYYTLTHFS